MGIISKTASGSVSVFSFLFGRHNLRNTKKNLSEVQRIAKAYKDILVKDREGLAADLDDKAIVESEYTKRFKNLRIYTSMVFLVFAYYIYCTVTAPTVYDLVCKSMTMIILLYLYLALARYMAKLRLAYGALPNKLSEEDGSITWSRFAVLVADKPSWLLPSGLNGKKI
jgi:hypothetical protein